MIDGRTPVIIGIGEASERVDEPGYQARSATELGAAAASNALDDTGVGDRVAAAIDVVVGVRQFEISSPLGFAPFGRSSNYPRAVAQRVGAAPARAVLEVAGGQAPQHLVNEFAAAIARGEADTVLLVGSEAISTARHLSKSETKPDWTEEIAGTLEDRGYGIAGLVTRQMVDHGLLEPVLHYALMDNARRARLGQSRADYAAAMGALFEPFTAAAAANPHAAAPVHRSAADLVTVSDANRMIAEPYPRYVVAREQVNQGAAVLLTSVDRARELGVPESQWVYLHGHVDLAELRLLERPDFDRSPATVAAVQHALAIAGIGIDEVGTLTAGSMIHISAPMLVTVE